MTRLPMSRVAAALLRWLLSRAAIDRDRILLSEVRSVDWQSLTFTGERHHLLFDLKGPGAEHACKRLIDGLEDAECTLPGAILADICANRQAGALPGSIGLMVEALTIAD